MALGSWWSRLLRPRAAQASAPRAPPVGPATRPSVTAPEPLPTPRTPVGVLPPAPPRRSPAGASASPRRAAGGKEADARRLSDARALEASGDRAGAYALLHERFVHLNAHEAEDLLPCLCRRCFQPDLTEIEVAGARYVREWTAARGRVLYFWLPWELRDQARGVRSGVAARLHGRLRGQR